MMQSEILQEAYTKFLIFEAIVLLQMKTYLKILRRWGMFKLDILAEKCYTSKVALSYSVHTETHVT